MKQHARTSETSRSRTLKRRVLFSAAGALISAGALIVVISAFSGSVSRALNAAPLLAVGELVALQLLTLALRAEAWGMNMRAAGGGLKRSEVQAASAMTFLASNFVPALVPNLLRIGLLRRLRPDSEAGVSVMAGADGVGLMIEVLINTLFIAAALLFLPSVSRWWSVLVLALPAAVVGLVWVLRHHFRHRRFMRAFDIMDEPGKLGKLTVLLFVVLVVQPARFYIALHAVGVHASAGQALLAFVAGNLISAIPFLNSAAATVAGAGAVLGASNPSALPAAVAAGALLAATALAASLIHASWTPVVLRRVFTSAAPAADAE